MKTIEESKYFKYVAWTCVMVGVFATFSLTVSLQRVTEEISIASEISV